MQQTVPMTASASAFVGRASELARLRGLVDGAPAGPRLAVVVGEGGVGKTRLVDELVGDVGAGSVPVRVVRGRADEHDPAPFGLWVGPLRLLDLPRPGSDPSVPAAEQRWDVVDLLRGALDGDRTLLALDDLHWADDESLWVLDRLVDDLAGTATTVVATTRPGTEVRAPRWHGIYRRADVVALDGLDVGEVATLVGHLGGDLDAHLLWERTGGNPFLVREQVVARDAGAVPAGAGALLGAALGRAGDDVAAVLSVMAVAGAGTPLDVVADAAGVAVADVDRALVRAREADLIRDDDGEPRFRHDLLAEAAVDRLGSDEVGRVHLAVAEGWRRRAGTRRRRRGRDGPSPGAGPARGRRRRRRHQRPGGCRPDCAATGDAVRAAHLLDLARSALDAHPGAPADVVARVALAAAEAAWEIDDMEGATSSAEIALVRAEAAGDPVLIAGAEIAALRHHNPFVPDPVRVERLAAVDAALPAEVDDAQPALRIALRGRRAIMTMSLPERLEEAVALGDDVVRRARAAGDPEALVGALRDRFFVLVGPDDLAAKAAAAEEILEAAVPAGRPELGLLGLEWRYTSRLVDADLPGAVGALTRLEALRGRHAVALWRYTAAVRRSSVLLLVGDYDGADRPGRLDDRPRSRPGRATSSSTGSTSGCGSPPACSTGAGTTASRRAVGALAAMSGDAPVLFIQTHLAACEVSEGELAAARRRIAPWAGRLGVALRGPEGLGVLAMLSRGDRVAPVAGGRRRADRPPAPVAGRIASVNGVGVLSTVDQHLAGLSLLDGDLEAAAEHAAAAVALARRFGAPAIEARSLALAAVVRDRMGDESAARSARDAAEALAEPIGLVLDPADGSAWWGAEPVTPVGRRRPR